MSGRDLERLAQVIGGIMRAGVALSAATLGGGLLMMGIGRPQAARVLEAGLVLLMLIPSTRILVSFVDALYRRDKWLAIATAIVSSILAWQLLKVF